nr:succinate--CoA ligase subunit alpha [Pseudomonadota bacterium]
MAILADRNTRIIVQGITGREAASFTRDMIDYGSKVV